MTADHYVLTRAVASLSAARQDLQALAEALLDLDGSDQVQGCLESAAEQCHGIERQIDRHVLVALAGEVQLGGRRSHQVALAEAALRRLVRSRDQAGQVRR